MHRDLTHEITTLEQHRAALLTQLDQTYQTFLAEARRFLSDWYWQTAETIIKTHPHITRSLGGHALTSLKGQIRALESRTETIVMRFFAQSNCWWHMNNHTNMTQTEPNGRKFISSSLRQAMQLSAGELAPLLSQHGYPDRIFSDGQWGEEIEWPHSLRKLVFDYDKLASEIRRTELELSRLRTQQAEAEAQAMWDNA